MPIVTHLHGGHTQQESDGYPEAWYLPNAQNIKRGFAKEGTYYRRFEEEFFRKFGIRWRTGTATFQYGNSQRATALWYHDHALGLTRLNMYAGLAGMYILRGGESDLPRGVLPDTIRERGLDSNNECYEIPLIIQDRSFNQDGSLFFPDSAAYDGANPPYIPFTDIPPIWIPGFSADAIVVNGNTWPVLNVEPRRYRFRILDGSNNRALILKLASNPTATRPVTSVLPFYQIGNDGGFLPAPVELSQLTLAPAQRADVIIDFSKVAPGTDIYMINEGPDGPLSSGFTPADTNTTGQIMKFSVVPLRNADTSLPVSQLKLPPVKPIPTPAKTRRLSVDEIDSTTNGNIPVMMVLGVVNSDGTPHELMWSDSITETPTEGISELWEINNFTSEAHPIHVHQTMFEVVNRQLSGESATPPEPGERGRLDTVIAYPGITRIALSFDISGRYVWHCHIIDHEDNEMMRPFQVLAKDEHGHSK
ncbi:multicopper oxidase domain-containing protein [Streptomyces sp. NPDC051776]|uniref:multicopper oxidase family protein n=1 Tax=Streptomyces sp. NPDC051776 TaxID=3155414 RepID=UPI0034264AD0